MRATALAVLARLGRQQREVVQAFVASRGKGRTAVRPASHPERHLRRTRITTVVCRLSQVLLGSARSCGACWQSPGPWRHASGSCSRPRFLPSCPSPPASQVSRRSKHLLVQPALDCTLLCIGSLLWPTSWLALLSHAGPVDIASDIGADVLVKLLRSSSVDEEALYQSGCWVDLCNIVAECSGHASCVGLLAEAGLLQVGRILRACTCLSLVTGAAQHD